MKVNRLNSKRLAQLVAEALDDLKGQSISCINVKKLTEITDYMVIVTGRSNTHIKALADAVTKKAKESGEEVVGVEGRLQSEWVLVDVGDVVVHIMMAPVRALYNLEELWSFSCRIRSRKGSRNHFSMSGQGMKVSLISVGTRMPAWVQKGVEEYQKRLSRDLGLNIIEIPLSKRSKSQSTEQNIKQ